LWVVAESMDFSDISRLYSGLRGADQQQVAENLNLKIDFSTLTSEQQNKIQKRHPLASWLEQLTLSEIRVLTMVASGTSLLLLRPPQLSERTETSIFSTRNKAGAFSAHL